MHITPIQLVLKNGEVFDGHSPAWQTDTAMGEVVFTTGMTGYIETLTDPSYAGQIVVFTYPLIGNYGVPSQTYWESTKIHACGVVVSEACENWSHAQGNMSLLEWLKEQDVPIITGVDTRALTLCLRENGTMQGTIARCHPSADWDPEKKIGRQKILFPKPGLLLPLVSPTKKQTYGNGKKIIFAIDCGMKENSMRELSRFDVTIHRVSYDYDYTNEPFDGLFFSNGPGDPMDAKQTIEIMKKAMLKKKPIFGICLGSQLMGLAAGAKTYKLPFGHRGHNQPVIETKTKRCVVTSQNHGYAVHEKSLPKNWRVSYRNLNDGSVEGIEHKTLPFFSVQFHPEAAPGPTDTRDLFEKFVRMMR